MNYIKHYRLICERAKNRKITGYYERHHIFPISIFGKNKRIVKLTAKEHFICHFLLFKYCKKKYGLSHWKTKKMGYAFYKMTFSSKKQERYTSKSYDLAKQWYSLNNPSKYRDISGTNNPMFGKTGNLHHLYGIPCSKDRKEKISRANKGKLVGDLNPAKRKEVREKISQNRKGKGIYTRKTHPKTILTDDIVRDILILWNLEKEKGLSGYKFCKTYHKKYGVSFSGLGNIIWKIKSIS